MERATQGCAPQGPEATVAGRCELLRLATRLASRKWLRCGLQIAYLLRIRDLKRSQFYTPPAMVRIL